MPSTSAKQHRLMEAAAHTKGGYGGVPQSVGKDFVTADAGKGSPKSREEHMTRRTKHVTQSAAGKEFGVHQSTVSRKVMKRGYTKGRM